MISGVFTYKSRECCVFCTDTYQITRVEKRGTFSVRNFGSIPEKIIRLLGNELDKISDFSKFTFDKDTSEYVVEIPDNNFCENHEKESIKFRTTNGTFKISPEYVNIKRNLIYMI